MGKCSSKERGNKVVSKNNAVQKAASEAPSSSDAKKSKDASSSTQASPVPVASKPPAPAVVSPLPSPSPSPSTASILSRNLSRGSVSERYHDAQEELPEFPALDPQGNLTEEHKVETPKFQQRTPVADSAKFSTKAATKEQLGLSRKEQPGSSTKEPAEVSSSPGKLSIRGESHRLNKPASNKSPSVDPKEKPLPLPDSTPTPKGPDVKAAKPQGKPAVAEAKPPQGKPAVAEAKPPQGKPAAAEAKPLQGKPAVAEAKAKPSPVAKPVSSLQTPKPSDARSKPDTRQKSSKPPGVDIIKPTTDAKVMKMKPALPSKSAFEKRTAKPEAKADESREIEVAKAAPVVPTRTEVTDTKGAVRKEAGGGLAEVKRTPTTTGLKELVPQEAMKSEKTSKPRSQEASGLKEKQKPEFQVTITPREALKAEKTLESPVIGLVETASAINLVQGKGPREQAEKVPEILFDVPQIFESGVGPRVGWDSGGVQVQDKQVIAVEQEVKLPVGEPKQAVQDSTPSKGSVKAEEVTRELDLSKVHVTEPVPDKEQHGLILTEVHKQLEKTEMQESEGSTGKAPVEAPLPGSAKQLQEVQQLSAVARDMSQEIRSALEPEMSPKTEEAAASIAEGRTVSQGADELVTKADNSVREDEAVSLSLPQTQTLTQPEPGTVEGNLKEPRSIQVQSGDRVSAGERRDVPTSQPIESTALGTRELQKSKVKQQPFEGSDEKRLMPPQSSASDDDAKAQEQVEKATDTQKAAAEQDESARRSLMVDESSEGRELAVHVATDKTGEIQVKVEEEPSASDVEASAIAERTIGTEESSKEEAAKLSTVEELQSLPLESAKFESRDSAASEPPSLIVQESTAEQERKFEVKEAVVSERASLPASEIVMLEQPGNVQLYERSLEISPAQVGEIFQVDEENWANELDEEPKAKELKLPAPEISGVSEAFRLKPAETEPLQVYLTENLERPSMEEHEAFETKLPKASASEDSAGSEVQLQERSLENLETFKKAGKLSIFQSSGEQTVPVFEPFYASEPAAEVIETLARVKDEKQELHSGPSVEVLPVEVSQIGSEAARAVSENLKQPLEEAATEDLQETPKEAWNSTEPATEEVPVDAEEFVEKFDAAEVEDEVIYPIELSLANVADDERTIVSTEEPGADNRVNEVAEHSVPMDGVVGGDDAVPTTAANVNVQLLQENPFQTSENTEPEAQLSEQRLQGEFLERVQRPDDSAESSELSKPEDIEKFSSETQAGTQGMVRSIQADEDEAEQPEALKQVKLLEQPAEVPAEIPELLNSAERIDEPVDREIRSSEKQPESQELNGEAEAEPVQQTEVLKEDEKPKPAAVPTQELEPALDVSDEHVSVAEVPQVEEKETETLEVNPASEQLDRSIKVPEAVTKKEDLTDFAIKEVSPSKALELMPLPDVVEQTVAHEPRKLDTDEKVVEDFNSSDERPDVVAEEDIQPLETGFPASEDARTEPVAEASILSVTVEEFKIPEERPHAVAEDIQPPDTAPVTSPVASEAKVIQDVDSTAESADDPTIQAFKAEEVSAIQNVELTEPADLATEVPEEQASVTSEELKILDERRDAVPEEDSQSLETALDSMDPALKEVSPSALSNAVERSEATTVVAHEPREVQEDEDFDTSGRHDAVADKDIHPCPDASVESTEPAAEASVAEKQPSMTVEEFKAPHIVAVESVQPLEAEVALTEQVIQSVDGTEPADDPIVVVEQAGPAEKASAIQNVERTEPDDHLSLGVQAPEVQYSVTSEELRALVDERADVVAEEDSQRLEIVPLTSEDNAEPAADNMDAATKAKALELRVPVAELKVPVAELPYVTEQSEASSVGGAHEPPEMEAVEDFDTSEKRPDAFAEENIEPLETALPTSEAAAVDSVESSEPAAVASMLEKPSVMVEEFKDLEEPPHVGAEDLQPLETAPGASGDGTESADTQTVDVSGAVKIPDERPAEIPSVERTDEEGQVPTSEELKALDERPDAVAEEDSRQSLETAPKEKANQFAEADGAHQAPVKVQEFKVLDSDPVAEQERQTRADLELMTMPTDDSASVDQAHEEQAVLNQEKDGVNAEEVFPEPEAESDLDEKADEAENPATDSSKQQPAEIRTATDDWGALPTQENLDEGTLESSEEHTMGFKAVQRSDVQSSIFPEQQQQSTVLAEPDQSEVIKTVAESSDNEQAEREFQTYNVEDAQLPEHAAKEPFKAAEARPEVDIPEESESGIDKSATGREQEALKLSDVEAGEKQQSVECFEKEGLYEKLDQGTSLTAAAEDGEPAQGEVTERATPEDATEERQQSDFGQESSFQARSTENTEECSDIQLDTSQVQEPEGTPEVVVTEPLPDPDARSILDETTELEDVTEIPVEEPASNCGLTDLPLHSSSVPLEEVKDGAETGQQAESVETSVQDEPLARPKLLETTLEDTERAPPSAQNVEQMDQPAEAALQTLELEKAVVVKAEQKIEDETIEHVPVVKDGDHSLHVQTENAEDDVAERAEEPSSESQYEEPVGQVPFVEEAADVKGEEEMGVSDRDKRLESSAEVEEPDAGEEAAADEGISEEAQERSEKLTKVEEPSERSCASVETETADNLESREMEPSVTIDEASADVVAESDAAEATVPGQEAYPADKVLFPKNVEGQMPMEIPFALAGTVEEADGHTMEQARTDAISIEEDAEKHEGAHLISEKTKVVLERSMDDSISAQASEENLESPAAHQETKEMKQALVLVNEDDSSISQHQKSPKAVDESESTQEVVEAEITKQAEVTVTDVSTEEELNPKLVDIEGPNKVQADVETGIANEVGAVTQFEHDEPCVQAEEPAVGNEDIAKAQGQRSAQILDVVGQVHTQENFTAEEAIQPAEQKVPSDQFGRDASAEYKDESISPQVYEDEPATDRSSETVVLESTTVEAFEEQHSQELVEDGKLPVELVNKQEIAEEAEPAKLDQSIGETPAITEEPESAEAVEDQPQGSEATVKDVQERELLSDAQFVEAELNPEPVNIEDSTVENVEKAGDIRSDEPSIPTQKDETAAWQADVEEVQREPTVQTEALQLSAMADTGVLSTKEEHTNVATTADSQAQDEESDLTTEAASEATETQTGLLVVEPSFAVNEEASQAQYEEQAGDELDPPGTIHIMEERRFPELKNVEELTEEMVLSAPEGATQDVPLEEAEITETLERESEETSVQLEDEQASKRAATAEPIAPENTDALAEFDIEDVLEAADGSKTTADGQVNGQSDLQKSDIEDEVGERTILSDDNQEEPELKRPTVPTEQPTPTAMDEYLEAVEHNEDGTESNKAADSVKHVQERAVLHEEIEPTTTAVADDENSKVELVEPIVDEQSIDTAADGHNMGETLEPEEEPAVAETFEAAEVNKPTLTDQNEELVPTMVETVDAQVEETEKPVPEDSGIDVEALDIVHPDAAESEALDETAEAQGVEEIPKEVDETGPEADTNEQSSPSQEVDAFRELTLQISSHTVEERSLGASAGNPEDADAAVIEEAIAEENPQDETSPKDSQANMPDLLEAEPNILDANGRSEEVEPPAENTSTDSFESQREEENETSSEAPSTLESFESSTSDAQAQKTPVVHEESTRVLEQPFEEPALVENPVEGLEETEESSVLGQDNRLVAQENGRKSAEPEVDANPLEAEDDEKHSTFVELEPEQCSLTSEAAQAREVLVQKEEAPAEDTADLPQDGQVVERNGRQPEEAMLEADTTVAKEIGSYQDMLEKEPVKSDVPEDTSIEPVEIVSLQPDAAEIHAVETSTLERLEIERQDSITADAGEVPDVLEVEEGPAQSDIHTIPETLQDVPQLARDLQTGEVPEETFVSEEKSTTKNKVDFPAIPESVEGITTEAGHIEAEEASTDSRTKETEAIAEVHAAPGFSETVRLATQPETDDEINEPISQDSRKKPEGSTAATRRQAEEPSVRILSREVVLQEEPLSSTPDAAVDEVEVVGTTEAEHPGQEKPALISELSQIEQTGISNVSRVADEEPPLVTITGIQAGDQGLQEPNEMTSVQEVEAAEETLPQGIEEPAILKDFADVQAEEPAQVEPTEDAIDAQVEESSEVPRDPTAAAVIEDSADAQVDEPAQLKPLFGGEPAADVEVAHVEELLSRGIKEPTAAAVMEISGSVQSEDPAEVGPIHEELASEVSQGVEVVKDVQAVVTKDETASGGDAAADTQVEEESCDVPRDLEELSATAIVDPAASEAAADAQTEKREPQRTEVHNLTTVTEDCVKGEEPAEVETAGACIKEHSATAVLDSADAQAEGLEPAAVAEMAETAPDETAAHAQVDEGMQVIEEPSAAATKDSADIQAEKSADGEPASKGEATADTQVQGLESEPRGLKEPVMKDFANVQEEPTAEVAANNQVEELESEGSADASTEAGPTSGGEASADARHEELQPHLSPGIEEFSVPAIVEDAQAEVVAEVEAASGDEVEKLDHPRGFEEPSAAAVIEYSAEERAAEGAADAQPENWSEMSRGNEDEEHSTSIPVFEDEVAADAQLEETSEVPEPSAAPFSEPEVPGGIDPASRGEAAAVDLSAGANVQAEEPEVAVIAEEFEQSSEVPQGVEEPSAAALIDDPVDLQAEEPTETEAAPDAEAVSELPRVIEAHSESTIVEDCADTQTEDVELISEGKEPQGINLQAEELAAVENKGATAADAQADEFESEDLQGNGEPSAAAIMEDSLNVQAEEQSESNPASEDLEQTFEVPRSAAAVIEDSLDVQAEEPAKVRSEADGQVEEHESKLGIEEMKDSAEIQSQQPVEVEPTYGADAADAAAATVAVHDEPTNVGSNVEATADAQVEVLQSIQVPIMEDSASVHQAEVELEQIVGGEAADTQVAELKSEMPRDYEEHSATCLMDDSADVEEQAELKPTLEEPSPAAVIEESAADTQAEVIESPLAKKHAFSRDGPTSGGEFAEAQAEELEQIFDVTQNIEEPSAPEDVQAEVTPAALVGEVAADAQAEVVLTCEVPEDVTEISSKDSGVVHTKEPAVESASKDEVTADAQAEDFEVPRGIEESVTADAQAEEPPEVEVKPIVSGEAHEEPEEAEAEAEEEAEADIEELSAARLMNDSADVQGGEEALLKPISGDLVQNSDVSGATVEDLREVEAAADVQAEKLESEVLPGTEEHAAVEDSAVQSEPDAELQAEELEQSLEVTRSIEPEDVVAAPAVDHEPAFKDEDKVPRGIEEPVMEDSANHAEEPPEVEFGGEAAADAQVEAVQVPQDVTELNTEDSGVVHANEPGVELASKDAKLQTEVMEYSANQGDEPKVGGEAAVDQVKELESEVPRGIELGAAAVMEDFANILADKDPAEIEQSSEMLEEPGPAEVEAAADVQAEGLESALLVDVQAEVAPMSEPMVEPASVGAALDVQEKEKVQSSEVLRDIAAVVQAEERADVELVEAAGIEELEPIEEPSPVAIHHHSAEASECMQSSDQSSDQELAQMEDSADILEEGPREFQALPEVDDDDSTEGGEQSVQIENLEDEVARPPPSTNEATTEIPAKNESEVGTADAQMEAESTSVSGLPEIQAVDVIEQAEGAAVDSSNEEPVLLADDTDKENELTSSQEVKENDARAAQINEEQEPLETGKEPSSQTQSDVATSARQGVDAEPSFERPQVVLKDPDTVEKVFNVEDKSSNVQLEEPEADQGSEGAVGSPSDTVQQAEDNVKQAGAPAERSIDALIMSDNPVQEALVSSDEAEEQVKKENEASPEAAEQVLEKPIQASTAVVEDHKKQADEPVEVREEQVDEPVDVEKPVVDDKQAEEPIKADKINEIPMPLHFPKVANLEQEMVAARIQEPSPRKTQPEDAEHAEDTDEGSDKAELVRSLQSSQVSLKEETKLEVPEQNRREVSREDVEVQKERLLSLPVVDVVPSAVQSPTEPEVLNTEVSDTDEAGVEAIAETTVEGSEDVENEPGPAEVQNADEAKNLSNDENAETESLAWERAVSSEDVISEDAPEADAVNSSLSLEVAPDEKIHEEERLLNESIPVPEEVHSEETTAFEGLESEEPEPAEVPNASSAKDVLNEQLDSDRTKVDTSGVNEIGDEPVKNALAASSEDVTSQEVTYAETPEAHEVMSSLSPLELPVEIQEEVAPEDVEGQEERLLDNSMPVVEAVPTDVHSVTKPVSSTVAGLATFRALEPAAVQKADEAKDVSSEQHDSVHSEPTEVDRSADNKIGDEPVKNAEPEILAREPELPYAETPEVESFKHDSLYKVEQVVEVPDAKEHITEDTAEQSVPEPDSVESAPEGDDTGEQENLVEAPGAQESDAVHEALVNDGNQDSVVADAQDDDKVKVEEQAPEVDRSADNDEPFKNTKPEQAASSEDVRSEGVPYAAEAREAHAINSSLLSLEPPVRDVALLDVEIQEERLLSESSPVLEAVPAVEGSVEKEPEPAEAKLKDVPNEQLDSESTEVDNKIGGEPVKNAEPIFYQKQAASFASEEAHEVMSSLPSLEQIQEVAPEDVRVQEGRRLNNYIPVVEAVPEDLHSDSATVEGSNVIEEPEAGAAQKADEAKDAPNEQLTAVDRSADNEIGDEPVKNAEPEILAQKQAEQIVELPYARTPEAQSSKDGDKLAVKVREAKEQISEGAEPAEPPAQSIEADTAAIELDGELVEAPDAQETEAVHGAPVNDTNQAKQDTVVDVPDEAQHDDNFKAAEKAPEVERSIGYPEEVSDKRSEELPAQRAEDDGHKEPESEQDEDTELETDIAPYESLQSTREVAAAEEASSTLESSEGIDEAAVTLKAALTTPLALEEQAEVKAAEAQAATKAVSDDESWELVSV